jgi:hypothetical protein
VGKESGTTAEVMHKRDNDAAAVSLLEDCGQKAPDSGEYRYRLGMALLGSGQELRAKTNLEAALRMRSVIATTLRPENSRCSTA